MACLGIITSSSDVMKIIKCINMLASAFQAEAAPSASSSVVEANVAVDVKVDISAGSDDDVAAAAQSIDAEGMAYREVLGEGDIFMFYIDGDFPEILRDGADPEGVDSDLENLEDSIFFDIKVDVPESCV